ncbi:DUF1993 family protein [Patescibacteria group bacterium]|nr:DUF1993 family protein [Patescibacteria group bacterium]
MQETNLYTVTIPPLIKSLTALKKILEKAKAHTDTKKLSWMDFEHALLSDKLVFNQFDFKKQVQLACDNAKGAAARLAEVEVPKHEDTEATFTDLVARIDKTLEFIATIKPEQVIGKEDSKVTLPYWPDKHLTGFEYATEYVIPNFYFHITTAYAILRKNGIDIGKEDFMGGLPLK